MLVADRDAPALAPGALVGGYVVERVLADQGEATVLACSQPGLDRLVAVKRLRGPVDERGAARLRMEARVASAASHPNVVVVHDIFDDDGVPCIVMDYLPGGSLRRHVGRLARPTCMRALEGVLAGLQHAHDRGIVHCDVKPENLLITDAGGVALADFGVAQTTWPADGGGAVERELGGTPAYVAPEQALGRHFGPAVDLYATGIVAYELLLGCRPFSTTRSVLETLLTRVHATPYPPARIDRLMPPRLAAWLEGMLARAPEDRPPSARAAAEELDDIAVELFGAFWRRGSELPLRGA
jgi:serine/threonine protein kinase